MKNRDIQPAAEETAVAVLGWLANEPDMLSRFLALSACSPVNCATQSTIRASSRGCSNS